MSDLQLTLEDAELAARDGHAGWWSTAMTGIKYLAAQRVPFTAYDLVVVCGVPEPASSAHWGAVLKAARREGLIEAAGYTQSARPETRGSAVRTWRGAS